MKQLVYDLLGLLKQIVMTTAKLRVANNHEGNGGLSAWTADNGEKFDCVYSQSRKSAIVGCGIIRLSGRCKEATSFNVARASFVSSARILLNTST